MALHSSESTSTSAWAFQFCLPVCRKINELSFLQQDSQNIYTTFSYGKIHNQNGEREAGDKHGERENEKREQSSA